MLSVEIFRGNVFSYLGEVRLSVNGTALVDYTDWGITAHLIGSRGGALEIVTCEWLDIENGLFRLRIEAADLEELPLLKNHYMYIALTSPSGDENTYLVAQVRVKRMQP